jgi:hypothetical protein
MKCVFKYSTTLMQLDAGTRSKPPSLPLYFPASVRLPLGMCNLSLLYVSLVTCTSDSHAWYWFSKYTMRTAVRGGTDPTPRRNVWLFATINACGRSTVDFPCAMRSLVSRLVALSNISLYSAVHDRSTLAIILDMPSSCMPRMRNYTELLKCFHTRCIPTLFAYVVSQ